MNNWIDLEDDFPEDRELVLFCDALSSTVSVGYYEPDDDSIYVMAIHEIQIDSEPTHWIRWPALPEVCFE